MKIVATIESPSWEEGTLKKWKGSPSSSEDVSASLQKKFALTDSFRVQYYDKDVDAFVVSVLFKPHLTHVASRLLSCQNLISPVLRRPPPPHLFQQDLDEDEFEDFLEQVT